MAAGTTEGAGVGAPVTLRLHRPAPAVSPLSPLAEPCSTLHVDAPDGAVLAHSDRDGSLGLSFKVGLWCPAFMREGEVGGRSHYMNQYLCLDSKQNNLSGCVYLEE